MKTKRVHYKVTDPNGRNHRFSNLPNFCRKYDLPYNLLYKVVNGKKYSCKGWRNGWYMGPYEPLHVLSDDKIKRILDLYPSCKPTEIAERLEISRLTVVGRLKKAGVYKSTKVRRTRQQLQEAQNDIS